jgi:2'-hydroxyisoflavone reductase
MRLLIVGGTGFIGRRLVEAALARGHELTLFNRGITDPTLFPEAEHLRGDRREGDLESLAGHRFDAVVDTCGYFPREVEALAHRLATATDHYTFISSLSVFPDPVARGTDESAPVAELEGPPPDEITSAEVYGALKARCERAAEAALPGRVLAVRPGVVAGPHDPTDRFTYWPRRISEGGRVLGARHDQPVQLIDVRDLAAWIVHSAEARLTGTFNAVGPADPLTMGGLFEACLEATGSDAEPVWKGDAVLRRHGLEPWSDLPLWLTADNEGFNAIDCSRAIYRGLRFRPLAETAADTLAWDRSRPAVARVDHLPRERERELLSR